MRESRWKFLEKILKGSLEKSPENCAKLLLFPTLKNLSSVRQEVRKSGPALSALYSIFLPSIHKLKSVTNPSNGPSKDNITINKSGTETFREHLISL
jgi:hypothetical protein